MKRIAYRGALAHEVPGATEASGCAHWLSEKYEP